MNEADHHAWLSNAVYRTVYPAFQHKFEWNFPFHHPDEEDGRPCAPFGEEELANEKLGPGALRLNGLLLSQIERETFEVLLTLSDQGVADPRAGGVVFEGGFRREKPEVRPVTFVIAQDLLEKGDGGAEEGVVNWRWEDIHEQTTMKLLRAGNFIPRLHFTPPRITRRG